MLVSLGLFKLNTLTRGILEAETVLNRTVFNAVRLRMRLPINRHTRLSIHTSRKEEDHIRSIICTVSENSSLIQMLNGKKTQRLMTY